MSRGFTLIELMIVVAIIGIISIVGGISLSSRMASSKLESAAQSLAADLEYARTAAIFKGCHTRFIFCMDDKCTIRDVSQQGATGFIGKAGEPARFYAILRRAQYDPLEISSGCYYDPSQTPDPSPAPTYYDEWDFDRKPQRLPRDLVFTAIYNFTGGVPDQSDWAPATGASAALNSLYFHSSPNIATGMQIPVDDSTMPEDAGSAAFQITFEDCNPASVDDDCTGYIISITNGGEANVTQCEPGARSNGTNICF